MAPPRAAALWVARQGVWSGGEWYGRGGGGRWPLPGPDGQPSDGVDRRAQWPCPARGESPEAARDPVRRGQGERCGDHEEQACANGHQPPPRHVRPALLTPRRGSRQSPGPIVEGHEDVALLVQPALRRCPPPALDAIRCVSGTCHLAAAVDDDLELIVVAHALGERHPHVTLQQRVVTAHDAQVAAHAVLSEQLRCHLTPGAPQQPEAFGPRYLGARPPRLMGSRALARRRSPRNPAASRMDRVASSHHAPRTPFRRNRRTHAFPVIPLLDRPPWHRVGTPAGWTRLMPRPAMFRSRRAESPKRTPRRPASTSEDSDRIVTSIDVTGTRARTPGPSLPPPGMRPAPAYRDGPVPGAQRARGPSCYPSLRQSTALLPPAMRTPSPGVSPRPSTPCRERGSTAGAPAVFVRLQGCTVGCAVVRYAATPGTPPGAVPWISTRSMAEALGPGRAAASS